MEIKRENVRNVISMICKDHTSVPQYQETDLNPTR
jgi:hypothetical protein